MPVNPLRESAQALKSNLDVTVGLAIRTVHILRGNDITGSRPLAIHRQRSAFSTGHDEINLVTMFVTPVADLHGLPTGHYFVEHKVLPERAGAILAKLLPAAIAANEPTLQTIHLPVGVNLDPP